MAGEYWGGFLFLSVLNAVAAFCYLALHRVELMSNRIVGAGA